MMASCASASYRSTIATVIWLAALAPGVDELQERVAEEPSGVMAVRAKRHPEHGKSEPAGFAAQAKE
jgi:hypothetical protein